MTASAPTSSSAASASPIEIMLAQSSAFHSNLLTIIDLLVSLEAEAGDDGDGFDRADAREKLNLALRAAEAATPTAAIETFIRATVVPLRARDSRLSALAAWSAFVRRDVDFVVVNRARLYDAFSQKDAWGPCPGYNATALLDRVAEAVRGDDHAADARVGGLLDAGRRSVHPKDRRALRLSATFMIESCLAYLGEARVLRRELALDEAEIRALYERARSVGEVEDGDGEDGEDGVGGPASAA